MKLPNPAPQYDQQAMIRANQVAEAEDLRNRKKGTDVELGASEKLVMRSPNGARWKITVSNTGVISAVAL